MVGYEPGPNLLPNPTFEDNDGKLPKGWKVRTYSGSGKAEHLIDTAKGFAKSGKASLCISSDGGHDTSVYATVKLKSGARYSLSAWIRTEKVEGVGMGALLNVHELQQKAMTKGIRKTNGWQKVETVFVNPSARTVTINCLFGGWGRSKGKAWYDDLSLNELKPVYKEKKDAEVKGRVEVGRKIFQTHLSAGCVRCHKVGGNGGDVGPPLDGLATRKQRDYIYNSLVKPNEVLAEGFEKFGASPMPPMDILLDKQEIADVMSYLLTLK